MTDDARSALERLAERGAPRGADAVFSAACDAAPDVEGHWFRRHGSVDRPPNRLALVAACGAAAVLVIAALALGLRRDDRDALEPTDTTQALACTVTVGSETGTVSMPVAAGNTAELTVAGYLTTFKVNVVQGARPPISLATVIYDPSGNRLMSTVGGVNPEGDAGPAGDVTQVGYHFECVAVTDPPATGQSAPPNVSDCPPGPRDTILLSPGSAGNLGLPDYVYSRDTSIEPTELARQFLRDAVFGPGCQIEDPSVLGVESGQGGHLVATATPPVTAHELTIAIDYETTDTAIGITRLASTGQAFDIDDNDGKPLLSWDAAPSDATLASVRFREGVNTWETNTSPSTDRLPLMVPGEPTETWPGGAIDWVLVTFFDDSGNVVGLVGGTP